MSVVAGSDLFRALIAMGLDVIEGDPPLAKRVRAILAPSTAADEWLTLPELGVSPRTARAAIKSGALIASKAGHKYVVRRADRDSWLAARQVGPRTVDAAAKSEAEIMAEQTIAAGLASGRLRVLGGRRR